jgi:hypothetical protein
VLVAHRAVRAVSLAVQAVSLEALREDSLVLVERMAVRVWRKSTEKPKALLALSIFSHSV